MSEWGPWSSVDWNESTPQAKRREVPSVVLKDQDSALFGVAPEYDRLVVAQCLFCDAVRRIECIAQHMLDEHPEEIEKKTSETCPDGIRENHNDEAQQSESWFVESPHVENNSGLPAPREGFIETLVIKKRNPSRRRTRPSNATPEVDVPSTSSGTVSHVVLNNLKRSSVKSLLEPALKRKFSLEKDREYDPNEHCGVVSDPSGKPCCYALGACKAHPVRHRRAVPGRRTSYDELVLEHRARAISGIAPSSTEISECSMSTESSAASTGSKSYLRDFEVTAEVEQPSEPDVLLPNGDSEKISSRGGSLVDGVASEIEATLDNRVSSRLGLPNELEVSEDIDFLGGTEIVGELPAEVDVAEDSVVLADIEVTSGNKTPSETEGRSRFTFENSSHRTETSDDIGILTQGIEITSEEILTTTMSGVPTTTAGILHITDAALTSDTSQLDGAKAADELTTIYEVIAINSPDSMGNLSLENGGETDPSLSIDEAFLLSHAPLESGLSEMDSRTQKDEQTSRKESIYLNVSRADTCHNGVISVSPLQKDIASTACRSDTTLSRSDGSEFALEAAAQDSTIKSHSGVTAALTQSESLSSPFSADGSTLLRPLTSEELRSRNSDGTTPLGIDSRTAEEFKTDAQNRSSVFLDDTANRFAVIVDPNKDTILSSLLFPNRYAASQSKSELSLRSTTSSTDQLFSEPATDVVSDAGSVAVHDGKLRNLLTRGKPPRSRSRLYHRRTERASQDSPGSSGAIANAPSESGNGVVEIPIKKPRIHWMMQTQSNHLNKICRLTGQNLPEYLRVYLRRPQLADLREQQSSPMSMSDDLSEVIE